MTAKTVRVPSLTLTIDQLLDVIQQLDTDDLNRVAQAVRDQQAGSSLQALRARLETYEPDIELSDEELVAEVKAVRAERAAQADSSV